jgi:hypothetical protein
VIDGWFYALEQDVLADASVDPNDAEELLSRTDALMEAPASAAISKTAPAFSAVLRTYRRAAGGRGWHVGGWSDQLAGGAAERGSQRQARSGHQG